MICLDAQIFFSGMGVFVHSSQRPSHLVRSRAPLVLVDYIRHQHTFVLKDPMHDATERHRPAHPIRAPGYAMESKAPLQLPKVAKTTLDADEGCHECLAPEHVNNVLRILANVQSIITVISIETTATHTPMRVNT